MCRGTSPPLDQAAFATARLGMEAQAGAPARRVVEEAGFGPGWHELQARLRIATIATFDLDARPAKGVVSPPT